MDPLDPTSFVHKFQKLTTGRTYHYVDQLPTDYDSTKSITLLLVHGFPDLWYGWRYQIAPWVRAGYRVIAPDMLGYGGTDKPDSPEEYNYSKLSQDLAALLDVVGVQKAVVIGHDWGSMTASRFALWQPDRLLALVLIAVPFLPPAKDYIPLEKLVEIVPDLGYQLYFADRVADSEVYNSLPLFVPMLHRKPGPLSIKFTRPGQMKSIMRDETHLDLQEIQASSYLSEKEREYYVSEYSKAKDMNGPLNYYRLWKLRFDDEKDLPTTVSADLPVLTLHGRKDPTSSPAWLENEKKLIPQLQTFVFEDVSHWVQIEMKEAVVEKVLEFVGGVVTSQKGKSSHL